MTSFATQYNIKYYSPYFWIGQHVLKAVQTLNKKKFIILIYLIFVLLCFVLFVFLHLRCFYKIFQTMMFNLKVSFESTKYFITKFTRCIQRIKHFYIFFTQSAVSAIHVSALTISLMSLTNNDVLQCSRPLGLSLSPQPLKYKILL